MIFAGAKHIQEINSNQEWWVFGEVSKQFEYEIFFAEADEIGYKRSKRGEQARPNNLLQKDVQGNVIVDTEEPRTILDWLKRKVKWD